MRLIKKNTIRYRSGNGRRGSVIVLVVAVLALLAVLGTVYIVSARSERQSAAAGSAAANLDYARAAVDKAFLASINGSVLDANGNIAGYGIVGSFGLGKMSRPWDMPEFGSVAPGQADYNSALPDAPWLVSNLYRPAVSPTADPRYNDLSVLSFLGFNPATGKNDIPYYTGPGAINPALAGSAFAVVDPMAPGFDAFVQLLPFSEANGTRYRFGVRILDTSRMANLNVGMTYGAASATQMDGTYFNGYNLANPNIFDSAKSDFLAGGDVADALGGSAIVQPVRAGGLTMTGATKRDLAWNQAAFRFENPSLFPTTPFDLSDELELRSYGTRGTMAIPRFAQAGTQAVWPNNLGNRIAGSANQPQPNPRRGYFTSYSYSRDLRPIEPAASFLLTPASGFAPPPPPGQQIVWPPLPARVGAGVDVTIMTTGQAADALAAAATNIATAMENISGYSHAEACAFAANYLTYRWNGWGTRSYTVAGNTIVAYYLTNGPSLVDQFGICLRTEAGPIDYGSVNDLHAEKADKVYLGHAAQPFINEMAITENSDGTTSTPTDWAVELYNPYNIPLSLDGYKLMVDGTAYDLSTVAAPKCIPARGYFVFARNGGDIASGITEGPTTTKKDDDISFTLVGGSKVYLMRPYTPRGGAPLSAVGAVDEYEFGSLTPSPTPGISSHFVRRSNNDTNIADPLLLSRWEAVVGSGTAETPTLVDATNVLTLGAANPAVAGSKAVTLWDRDVTVPQRSPFANIADFNRIMRVCNQFDASVTGAGKPVDGKSLSTQLAALIAAAPTSSNVKDTDLPVEASIHFDFRSVPIMYSYNLGEPILPLGYTGPPNAGDPRAIRLLNCLTFVDRVSDYTIDIGDNDASRRGVSKIRIPGQINVNTASAEVLASIPFLGTYPKYITAILAYRWRTTNLDNRIPAALQSYPCDYTAVPGYGIRSLAEINTLFAPATLTTLYDRDADWASIYNYLTVRCDTFVVYAYLEAVRQNPKYSGLFDNSLIWYNTTAAMMTDDPNDDVRPLLRVARRRWVAIVDRSMANYNRYVFDTGLGKYVLDPRFTSARVVAEKDLPQ